MSPKFGLSQQLHTGVTGCTAVDVSIKLSNHPQCSLIGVHLVSVVPQLPNLLVRVTHNARTRLVSFC